MTDDTRMARAKEIAQNIVEMIKLHPNGIIFVPALQTSGYTVDAEALLSLCAALPHDPPEGDYIGCLLKELKKEPPLPRKPMVYERECRVHPLGRFPPGFTEPTFELTMNLDEKWKNKRVRVRIEEVIE